MDKKIEQILKKYDLRTLEYIRKPDGGIIRSHVIKCLNKGGELIALKIFDSSDSIAKERFLGELRHLKSIRPKLSAKHRSYLPKIKFYDLVGENPFYAYDFSEGKKLGSFIKDFGFTHGCFTHNNFERFIAFIDALSEIEIKDSYKISRWSQNNARKELKYYLENTRDLFNPDLYDKILNFYDTYTNRAFKKFVFSHRDLYPENILIKEQLSNKFTFLDWEYFSKVPVGFNPAFIYLMFWREEFWKAKTFAYFYNKYEKLESGKYLSTFLDSFLFCVVILTTRFLYQMQAFADNETETVFHAKRSFLFDLNRALNRDIVKPRNVKFYIEQRDIEKVAGSFDIDKVKSYEIFYASKGNTVAKVVTTVSKKYIFRFYSDSRTRSLIKRELKIFERLRSNGIKTYLVSHTNKGRNILDINLYGKNRRIAVLSYLEGKKIARKWANGKSTANMADTLSKIHACGIIHGDFSKENVLFKRDKVSGVIDFEWGRFTRSKEVKKHDMAKAIALWMTDIRYKNISDEEFFEEFLKGYYKKDLNIESKIEILDLVRTKILAEKDIFVTTIDMTFRKSNVRRFDDILNKLAALKELYRTYKDKALL